jgi:hypothetical protein
MAGTGKESRLDSLKQRVVVLRERITPIFMETPIIVILLVGFAIVIQSGFILIISEPTPLFSGDFGFVQWDPGLNRQVIIETLVVALIISFGTIGLWLIKRAPVYVDDSDRASFTQISGIVLLAVCFVALYLLLVLKIFGNFNNLNIF